MVYEENVPRVKGSVSRALSKNNGAPIESCVHVRGSPRDLFVDLETKTRIIPDSSVMSPDAAVEKRTQRDPKNEKLNHVYHKYLFMIPERF